MAAELTIGHVARKSGCKVQTVRYYEQVGLLPSPRRSSGNQRLYDSAAVERLSFIRHARDLGFSLDAVRELLSLADTPDQPCAAADSIARARLLEVERRIARLTRLKVELERMIAQCSGGRIADCRIVQVLGDHSLCLSESHGSEKET